MGPPPACRVDRPGGGVLTGDRSIRICRKLERVAIREDVGDFQQLVMAEPPDGEHCW